MASLNYTEPGVYTERVKSAPTIQGISTAYAGFVGTCKRGRIDEPFMVTSKSDYKDKAAYGLDSDVEANSYLGWAVKSYFNNGGNICWISRAHTENIATASKTFEVEVTPAKDGNPAVKEAVIVEAKDPGAWGNKVQLSCTENELLEGTYDLTITCGSEKEVHRMLSNDEHDARYFMDYITVYSDFIKWISGPIRAFSVQTLEGGNDGEEGILDKHFLEALDRMDKIDEVTLIAMPGQTSMVSLIGICDYLSNHKFNFGALDAPMTYKYSEIKALRQQLSCDNAVLLNTWHRVNDELSNVNGKLRAIPSSGAYLGNVSKAQTEPGPWREPAGTNYVIRGAVELVWSATMGKTGSEVGLLNPLGVICIVAKKNKGIVIWGARSITTDSNYLYVSAIMMDIYIRRSIEEQLQDLVFEQNKGTTSANTRGNVGLWNKCESAAKSFLDYIMRQGGLASDDPATAYFAQCNAETNPKSVTDRGYCVTRCGYAYARPAEFIVFEVYNEVPASN